MSNQYKYESRMFKKGATRMLYKVEHEEEKASLETAARYTKSEKGRALQKKQAEFVERSFAHTLESGGMRRTTLHGTENISKRYQIAGFCVNISLLMRKRFGFGTAKQCAATGKKAVNAALEPWISIWQSLCSIFVVHSGRNSIFHLMARVTTSRPAYADGAFITHSLSG
jgi:hypothetical protein